MPLLIILGWLIFVGCTIYLAMDVAKNRLYERRAMKVAAKKIKNFKKHHHYDEKRGQWVRKRDGVVLADASGDAERHVMPFSYLMLVLWEMFWVVEIVMAPRLSQIPYLFLLVMMIGVPLTFLMLLRGIQRLAATA
jgi:hypothetical protein